MCTHRACACTALINEISMGTAPEVVFRVLSRHRVGRSGRAFGAPGAAGGPAPCDPEPSFGAHQVHREVAWPYPRTIVLCRPEARQRPSPVCQPETSSLPRCRLPARWDHPVASSMDHLGIRPPADVMISTGLGVVDWVGVPDGAAECRRAAS